MAGKTIPINLVADEEFNTGVSVTGMLTFQDVAGIIEMSDDGNTYIEVSKGYQIRQPLKNLYLKSPINQTIKILVDGDVRIMAESFAEVGLDAATVNAVRQFEVTNAARDQLKEKSLDAATINAIGAAVSGGAVGDEYDDLNAVTVDDTVDVVLTKTATGVEYLITNVGTKTAYLGGATVTAAKGTPLLPNGRFKTGPADLSSICLTGETTELRILELAEGA